MNGKIVYICSPYNTDYWNILWTYVDYAKKLTRAALRMNGTPFSRHFYSYLQAHRSMSSMLSELGAEKIDFYGEQITMAMDVGFEMINVCDTILIGIEKGISEDMEVAIKKAKEKNLDVFLEHNHYVAYIGKGKDVLKNYSEKSLIKALNKACINHISGKKEVR